MRVELRASYFFGAGFFFAVFFAGLRLPPPALPPPTSEPLPKSKVDGNIMIGFSFV